MRAFARVILPAAVMLAAMTAAVAADAQTSSQNELKSPRSKYTKNTEAGTVPVPKTVNSVPKGTVPGATATPGATVPGTTQTPQGTTNVPPGTTAAPAGTTYGNGALPPGMASGANALPGGAANLPRGISGQPRPIPGAPNSFVNTAPNAAISPQTAPAYGTPRVVIPQHNTKSFY